MSIEIIRGNLLCCYRFIVPIHYLELILCIFLTENLKVSTIENLSNFKMCSFMKVLSGLNTEYFWTLDFQSNCNP